MAETTDDKGGLIMTADEYIEMYPHQFSDNLDKWLFKEFNLSGGACSSIRSMEYNIAREVAVKLLDSLWKDANSDVLPEIDKDVIALEGLDKGTNYRVVFAHRVDPDRVIRTTIDNKPLELHPSRYGEAGWNLPNIKYWLDLELPKKV